MRAAIVLLFIATKLTAQQIGMVPLKLGAPKGPTIALLRAAYGARADSLGDSDTWFVDSEERDGSLLGTVSFRSGRVSRIVRLWSIKNSRNDMAKTVVAALSALSGESGCAVEHKVNETQAGTANGALVTCGAHSVLINVTTGQQGEMPAGIMEKWEVPPT